MFAARNAALHKAYSQHHLHRGGSGTNWGATEDGTQGSEHGILHDILQHVVQNASRLEEVHTMCKSIQAHLQLSTAHPIPLHTPMLHSSTTSADSHNSILTESTSSMQKHGHGGGVAIFNSATEKQARPRPPPIVLPMLKAAHRLTFSGQQHAECTAAAIKIQAGWRAYLARQRVSQIRRWRLKADSFEQEHGQTKIQRAVTTVRRLNKATFLPDSFGVNIVNALFFLLCVTEFFMVSLESTNEDNWNEPPSAQTATFRLLFSAFFFVFILIHTRIAVLKGWTLMDAHRDIRMLYLQSWMIWLDVVTTVPWDIIIGTISPSAFVPLSCIRLARILRVPTLFKYSSPLRVPSVSVKLLNFLFWLAISIHSIACVWILVDGDTRVESAATFNTKYNRSLYWAVTTVATVGYGDIIPMTNGTRLFCIAVQVAGTGLFAYLMGAFSAVLVHTDAMEEEIRMRKETLGAFMKRYAVPLPAQREMISIYAVLLEHTSALKRGMMQELPPFLREMMQKYVKLRLLKDIPLFSGEHHEIVREALAEKMVMLILPPDELVIRMGEIGHEMYILSKGMVEIIVNDRVVKMLSSGSYFGEIALLHEKKRTASVRTVTVCELFKLHKNDFETIVDAFPSFKNAISSVAEQRMEKQRPSTGGFGTILKRVATVVTMTGGDSPRSNKPVPVLSNSQQSADAISEESDDSYSSTILESVAGASEIMRNQLGNSFTTQRSDSSLDGMLASPTYCNSRGSKDSVGEGNAAPVQRFGTTPSPTALHPRRHTPSPQPHSILKGSRSNSAVNPEDQKSPAILQPDDKGGFWETLPPSVAGSGELFPPPPTAEAAGEPDDHPEPTRPATAEHHPHNRPSSARIAAPTPFLPGFGVEQGGLQLHASSADHNVHSNSLHSGSYSSEAYSQSSPSISHSTSNDVECDNNNTGNQPDVPVIVNPLNPLISPKPHRRRGSLAHSPGARPPAAASPKTVRFLNI